MTVDEGAMWPGGGAGTTVDDAAQTVADSAVMDEAARFHVRELDNSE